MPTIRLLVLIALSLPAFAATHASDRPDDPWRAYARVLDRHVVPGRRHGIRLNLVDYAGLRRDRDWRAVVDGLARFDPGTLPNEEARLAFYINAYNILAMKLVADHWPIDGIKDVGGLFSPVWGRTAGRIGGREVTLGALEDDILRKAGEPRIHFAIVCASVSCPDLRREPYRADRLDDQLDDQVRRFLDNPGKGLRLTNGRLLLSRIFDWFEADFESAGGAIAFVRRYRPSIPAVIGVAYLDYDWSVNAR